MKKPLLEQVRDLAREEAEARRDDDAWIRRAQGDLSAEEERALLGDASGPPDASEAAFLAAITAPRAAGADDASIDRAMGAAAASRPAAPVVPITSAASASSKRRAGALRWATPFVAVAAAVALYVGARGRGGAPLPPYSIDVQGVDAEQRSAPAPRNPDVRGALSAGARLEIVLRPSVAVASRVGAAGFVVQGDVARPLPVPVRVLDSGTVTLEGTREELFGEARGAADVVVWIGSPSALPASPDDARKPAPAAQSSVAKLVVPVTLK
jgi:hypothetical protein